MKKLEVSILKPNDIVLVETLVRRFIPRENNKRKAVRGWPYWKCSFDLCAISLLLKAPTDLPARSADSNVEVDI